MYHSNGCKYCKLTAFYLLFHYTLFVNTYSTSDIYSINTSFVNTYSTCDIYSINVWSQLESLWVENQPAVVKYRTKYTSIQFMGLFNVEETGMLWLQYCHYMEKAGK